MAKSKSMTAVTSKPAMNLVRLIEQYGTDDECREYLKHLRWPDGPECVKCGSKSLSWISTRRQFDCNSCRARFSVTAGTVFHDSHLPLWKWFVATYLMVESKKGVSANQLRRELAVTYKTAWYLCHRIRSAMFDAHPELLDDTVEMDETYIGGRARSGSRKFVGAGGTGGKAMVLGALERGGDIRLRVEPHRRASGPVLAEFTEDAVSGRVRAIYTDQHPGYSSAFVGDPKHESVDHSQDEWVRGDVSTQGIESAWSLLKRSIVGSYHQLSVKHLPAYLDEFTFKFNGRENPFLFRDTLIALCRADALPYKSLIRPE